MPRAILPLLLGATLLAAPALAQDTPTPAPAEAASAVASPPAELAGNWDLRIDGTTIFRFAIEKTATGEWRGRWQRPDSFNSNGNAFANMRGGVKSSASMGGNAVFELVELAFDDPRPGAVPDIFRFRLVGPDQVDMTYVGTQLAPYRLVRAGAGEALGNWDATRIYRRPVPGTGPTGGRPAAGEPAPAPSAPRAAQPTPDGRIILGRQVPFLDLSRRPAPPEEAPTQAPDEAPASPPAPATEAPEPASRIGEDFLEGL
ncbi:hypothetical protein [Alteraurantiacibacter buctensis]|uniref:Uncharacterized protein n=1 Tax=Alteraurantiacibacter buctensis TaxID=1503981 RepID=A0A844YSS1_9SPHN|nr:hypothetical protein [Alteraurantiacibacter buctensis]MXO70132.1 hypothetical protein [Alteraurantiacibacter buctensis]